MLKRLLLPILFSLPGITFAQAPDYFVDGSRWVYQTSESWETGQTFQRNQTEQYIIHGDTLIGNVVYRKLFTTIHATTTVYLPPPQAPNFLYSQDSLGPAFIRFDPVQNKVYYLPDTDSTERVIYDFNLQVGDLLPMQPLIFTPGRVDSIQTVSLFGKSVKKFYTSSNRSDPGYAHNYILEGLGGSNGLTLNQPVGWVVSGGLFSTSLLCFQSGDSTYTTTQGDCPFLEFISTKDALKDAVQVLISPNPTQGAFTVLVDEGLQHARFRIMDCTGKPLQSRELSEQTTPGQLPSPGIYFWTLEQQGQILRTGKLICH